LSAEYEKALQEQFGRLNKDNFKVQFAIKTLFVCGGIVHPVDKQLPPGSFRDRLMRYTAEKGIEFHDYIVLAEEFKDYYVDGNYRDLLTFEDDIASLSTLVIIFLESAGSLVELGLYCSRPAFFKKLLVVVPKDELETEDSFIYLGPLKFIESKVENSLVGGSPGKIIRQVNDFEREMILERPQEYIDLAAIYLNESQFAHERPSTLLPMYKSRALLSALKLLV